MVSGISNFSSRTIQNTLNRPNTTKVRKRSTTDGYPLLFHAAAICGLAGLVAYCFYHGNIKGITIGYDNCNNVCGRWNYVQEERKIFACEGSYMLIRPYLLVFRPDGRNSYNIRYTGLRMLDRLAPGTLFKDVDRVCVADCRMYPNHVPYGNRCIQKKTKVALLIPVLKVPFLLIDKYFKLRGVTPTSKFCMHYIEFNENLLKYFTRNAYIEVVIHGCKLRKAGEQAYQISTANNFHCISNNTGCFVLNLLKVLVSVITIITGTVIFQKDEGILHIWAILILIGYFAYLISDSFLSLYQAITDSIFMCFHEDCCHHDSSSKPYYASEEFLEFIGNYKSLSTESGSRKIQFFLRLNHAVKGRIGKPNSLNISINMLTIIITFVYKAILKYIQNIMKLHITH